MLPPGQAPLSLHALAFTSRPHNCPYQPDVRDEIGAALAMDDHNEGMAHLGMVAYINGGPSYSRHRQLAITTMQTHIAELTSLPNTTIPVGSINVAITAALQLAKTATFVLVSIRELAVTKAFLTFDQALPCA